MKPRLAAALLLGAFSLPLHAAETLWPSTQQWQALQRQTESDADASAVFQAQRRIADAALRDGPQAVAALSTEGRLAGDPVKVQTEAALRDMAKIQALAIAWTLDGDARYLKQAGAYLQAWAETNRPTGDPIDETGLEPAIFGYRLLRDHLPKAQRDKIDGWLREVARAEIASRNMKRKTATNNWHSHRLKIVGLIGFALNDQALIRYARDGLKQQLSDNLLPDGSSIDFQERDALSYHTYDLQPLLTLALAFAERGEDFYRLQAPSGASLQKSVAFLRPYLDGSRTHAEFVGSAVPFDKARSDHHEAGHVIGAAYDPRNAAATLELAAAFEPGYADLALKLSGGRPHLRWLISRLPG
ncbi:alginate lyase family protein [Chromobacterium sp. IIBBL 290-4]|uniref:alginate lyase family protein n=1 Tax=Chromobacterium sp. IIBBL 290-4 TaxID=2953890 RepID=UPI0020B867E1|nr:alginate lyase family protein [Chromobacterium sp. IIBBL 290-4]UTH75732.1 alginate lyase family protein [Chromobacterium sp. IIBBL 290-4]